MDTLAKAAACAWAGTAPLMVYGGGDGEVLLLPDRRPVAGDNKRYSE